MITNNIKSTLNLTNEIKVDDVIVKGQTATIDSNDPNDISFSDWTNDKALYKENRVEIRKLEAAFEDYAYTKQEEMLSGGTEENEISE